MALAGGEVDEAPFSQQVRPPPVGEAVLLHLGARCTVADGHPLEVRLRDLHIEVARIREQAAVLEHSEVLGPDDPGISRDGDDEVGLPGGVQHRHHPEAVEARFDRAHPDRPR